MKKIHQFLIEKLQLSKDKSGFFIPKTKEELKLEILKKRIDKEINYNDIDISNIDDLSYLFEDTDITEIDISEWDVSHVKNMKCMFTHCEYLKSVGDLSNWNVKNVEDMSWMFAGCKNLKSLGNLENWKINGTKMKCAFDSCKKLITLGNIYNWNPKEANWDIFQLCDCKPLPKKRP